MFEQSILAAQSTKRTWSLAVSLVGQTTLILFATLIPLIYTDQLPGLTKWAQRLVTPSPPPAHVPEPQSQEVSRQAATEAPVFRPPRNIPRGVMDLHESPRPPEPLDVGVVGLPYAPTVGTSIAQFLTNAAPVPKPPEVLHPSAPPTHREPIRVSSSLQEAKLLRKVIPVYPPLALTTRTQGTVHLIGVIARDGTIQDLKVVDGHPLLVRAAIDAVKQWIYKPTLLSGEPVEVVAPIEVRFILNR